LKRCPAERKKNVPSRRYCTIITLERRTRQGQRNRREAFFFKSDACGGWLDARSRRVPDHETPLPHRSEER
jgi:hypothetical protein